MMGIATSPSTQQGGPLMVAQAPEQLKRDSALSVERSVPEAASQLDALQQFIVDAAQLGTAAHEVERGLFQRLLRLGSTLFSAFLNLVGPGDIGDTATLDVGRTINRLDGLHGRRLLTVFGPFLLAP